jgi:hypothetical protein
MRLLIGLLLIIASPMALLLVGDQDMAGTFSSLNQVSAEGVMDGGVIIEGSTSAVPSSPLLCPNTDTACIYVETVREVYERSETIVCDEIPEDVVVLEQVEDRCDGSTGICDPCYLTEQYAWVQQEEGTQVEYAEFTVGAFYVKPGAETLFLQKESGEYQEFDGEEEGDERFQYEYVSLPGQLLVVGESSDGVIATASSEMFLVSTLGYESTLSSLVTRDKTARNGVRFMSLVLMVIGFVTLTSQVSGPVLGLFKILPGLGGFMEKSSKMAISVVAAVIGGIVWLAIFLPLSMIVL